MIWTVLLGTHQASQIQKLLNCRVFRYFWALKIIHLIKENKSKNSICANISVCISIMHWFYIIILSLHQNSFHKKAAVTVVLFPMPVLAFLLFTPSLRLALHLSPSCCEHQCCPLANLAKGNDCIWNQEGQHIQFTLFTATTVDPTEKQKFDFPAHMTFVVAGKSLLAEELVSY